MKRERRRVHAACEEIPLRAGERFTVRQRKPESMDERRRRSPRSVVGVRTEGAVAADDPAQVPPFVVVRVPRAGLEASAAEQRVTEREMRSPVAPLLRARNVLPAATCEESMVAAGDQLGVVVEHDPIGRLDGGPVGENPCTYVAAVAAPALGAIDLVADPERSDRLVASIRHENRCFAPDAVEARMGATSIRVDRPAKRHLRCLGHLVQGGLRANLIETDVEHLGGVEATDHRGVAVTEQPRLLFFAVIDLEIAPPHEHMFAYRSGVWAIAAEARHQPGGPDPDIAPSRTRLGQSRQKAHTRHGAR